MSSLEIADLLDKRHDKVKLSIDRLVERGVIAQPPTGDVQIKGGNSRAYTVVEYRLQKRDSYIVVAQLSPEFTARVVDRWQELEGEHRLPTDYLSALEALVAQVQQNQQLNTRLELSEAKSGSRPNQKSALAYAKMRNITLSNPQLARLGKLATQNGKANGREKETVTDERWGSVGIYDVRDLEAAWNFMFNSLIEGNA